MQGSLTAITQCPDALSPGGFRPVWEFAMLDRPKKNDKCYKTGTDPFRQMRREKKNKARSNPAGNRPQEKSAEFISNHRQRSSRASIGVCLLLAAITLIVFSRTFHYGFVDYDDGTYVYENAVVKGGLTPGGIGWAFTHSLAANWHPLTVLSLMLDASLYGLKAGGYHFTNVLLHTIAAILLFLVLKDLTGAHWRSAFVAALFAIHPLRVESVAWIAERKDVLSGVFFMLALWAYVRYARRSHPPGAYLLVALFLALGLMSKPMLVTLPLVLLLLDFWPLNRFAPFEQKSSLLFWRLFREKIPLLAISVAAGAIAFYTQKNVIMELFTQKNAIVPVAFPARIGNALVSYVVYIGQMFYPVKLSVFYPFARHLPLWEVATSFILLSTVSIGAFHWRRQCPYLLVGWLWYLGMLAPVMGLVQVGAQAHADRYTYLPQIGLYLALTWGITDLFSGWRSCRPALSTLAVVVIGILGLVSFHQTTYWRDSKSLWNRTLVAGTPNDAKAHNKLGMFLLSEGSVNDAIEEYQKALEIDPAFVQAHFNLGNAFDQNGQMDKAIEEYQRTIDLQPDYFQARNNLADAFLRTGHPDMAIEQLQEALKRSPQSTVVCNNLGFIYLRIGQAREAAAQFQKSLEVDPNNLDACHYLAWILATCPDSSMRNGPRAVDLAGRANQLSGGADPEILGTLSAAYACVGQFSEAITTAQRALSVAEDKNDRDAINELQSEIKFYQANLPVLDSSLTNSLP